MSMSRQQFPKQLQEGLNAVFGMAYDEWDPLWPKIFDEFTSNKAYEEDVLLVGLGGAANKAEGAPVMYDTGSEGWVARYRHDTVAIAFAITEEAQEDGLYGDLGQKYATSMARSMRYTKEVRGCSVLNNAFSASYLGGDAKALCATDHPLVGGGTLANKPSTDADLSEEALEDALIAIDGFVDDRGIPKMVKSKTLIVPRQSRYIAYRLMNSTGQTGTANNDPNAIKDMGMLRDVSVNVFLSDSDAWFIRTNCPDGLKHFSRSKLKKGMEGDFETGNLRYKSRERFSFGWTDFRSVYGSSGA